MEGGLRISVGETLELSYLRCLDVPYIRAYLPPRQTTLSVPNMNFTKNKCHWKEKQTNWERLDIRRLRQVQLRTTEGTRASKDNIVRHLPTELLNLSHRSYPGFAHRG
jgi:hypothetical protein